MATAVTSVFSAFVRSRSQPCAAVAANACVAALALTAATLGLAVVVEHPEAFALAHEALAQEAQPSRLARAEKETRLVAAEPVLAEGAATSHSPARPQPGAGTDCAPAETTPPHTAPAPASPARDLGDYPIMPVAAAYAAITIG